MGCNVETRFGRLEGREQRGLQVFRGIPYARAPVGGCRLRPPQPPEPWPGVRPAQQAGDSAPQNPGLVAALVGGVAERTSEDCLTLNIWTPGCDEARRPVLVFVHGGGFTTGSGSHEIFDGGCLSRRGDAVVVTLNYRLGALGYLALPALADGDGAGIGNFGLLDQCAALEWVHEHIGVFGGDPNNLTLFGQSAGAMSVAALLGLRRARGLFQRAILQSGAAQRAEELEWGVCVAEIFMKELGLAADDVRGLREAPLAALLAAQQRCVAALRVPDGRLPFQPVVDGELVTRPPLDAIRDGSAPAVPLLIGTNLDEWKLWGLRERKARTLDEAALLRRCCRSLPGRDGEARRLAGRAVETYREARRGRASLEPSELWFAMQADRWFRHPAMRLAELHAPHQRRTYAYLFTWKSPAMGGALGSCHALELPFVFGCIEQHRVARFVGDSPMAELLAQRIQDAWLSFACSGSPAHGGLGAWPTYEGGRRATVILGEQCAVEEAPLEAERAFWDALD